MIDKLTDNERRCGLPKNCEAYRVHTKLVSIVDKQAERITELESQVLELEEALQCVQDKLGEGS